MKKNNSSQAKRPRLHKRRVFSVSNQIRLKNRGAHLPEFDERGGRCEFCASKKFKQDPTVFKVYLSINDKKTTSMNTTIYKYKLCIVLIIK